MSEAEVLFGGQKCVAWETYLVPQRHLPVVPSGCTCGQELLQGPQKQDFVGSVLLVA